MAQNYDAKSIESLDYFEHIRRYPGMYIGSKDENGLLHLVKEVLSNSIDEWLNGAGSEIKVEIRTDGGIFIEDNGRGIPHGTQEDGMSLLQACFGKANTGGKFNNATGESGYNSSGGEHGTGGKCVNALSTKLIVTTARDGKKETVEFSRGQFISHKEEKSNEQGVSVLFYPDPEVLEVTVFNAEKIKTMIREFSFLCKGLRFILDNKGEIEEFTSNNGLYDFLEYLNDGKEYLIPPIYFEESEGTFQVEVAVGYNSSYTNTVRLYTNNIPQDKGTHLTGFKTAFTSAINTFAKQEKLLKDGQENLQGSDVEEGRILIINFRMIDPVFKGQNKEELSSSEGRTYVQRLSTKGLNDYFSSHKKDIKAIIDKALAAKKARDAAKKAREAVRNKNEKKKKVLKFDSKLADCWSKDRSKCEIIVTEGDSASGNLKKVRNNEFVAVMPVRGKILNVRKATLDKIQKNAEIMTMIEAFGLSVDPKTMTLTYEPEDLRYGKIIVMSDADVDGAHIKNLFYTFIWTFCPQLILDGYVYAGVPPLYRVSLGKDNYVYLKDDAELIKFKEEHAGRKFDIGRLKGLGEMDPEDTKILTDPDKRIIKQITVEDIEGADELFDDLMGTKVLPRKQFIQEHAHEAVYTY